MWKKATRLADLNKRNACTQKGESRHAVNLQRQNCRSGRVLFCGVNGVGVFEQESNVGGFLVSVVHHVVSTRCCCDLCCGTRISWPKVGEMSAARSLLLLHSTDTLSFVPPPEFKWEASQKVLPLTIIFVAMVAFNNLCLLYVEVTFYQVCD